jgi:nicotinamidase-related amidase
VPRKDAGSGSKGNKSRRALLLIDLVSQWNYADGKSLLRQTMPILPSLVRLRESAAAAHVPVIFVNDNFGQWRSDFRQVTAAARSSGPHAARIVDALQPGAEDYFVLKPRHSAFFATPLDLLLQELDADTLVLCGVAGDQCILASASEALLHRFRVIIPRDGIACATAQRSTAVLKHFHEAMDIPTPLSRTLRWRRAERSA